MKFLVTGGAGFIGSNLVRRLIEDEHEVIVIDNLHTGSLENLRGVLDKVQTVINPCSEILSLPIKNIDGVFHFGIASSSPMYKENPILIGEAIIDFIKILEFCTREHSKLVFASSSSIYNGNPTPWKEDMSIKVTDFYAETRYYMERLAKAYHNLYGVESIGLRMFSVFGPNEESKKRYANLVSQFLWAMQKNEQPVIYGDGEQSRDFINVKDVVRATMLAMNSDIECDILNIGTGIKLSLNEVVPILNKKLNKFIVPKYVENPIKNYIYHTLADTKKTETKLKFKAKYTLESGMDELIGMKNK